MISSAGASGDKKRILYIDFAPSPGGSIRSLIHILEHLPRQRYQPLALLAPTVASLPEIQALPVAVFTYDAQQGRAMSFGPAARQVRSSRTVSWVRQHPLFSWFWRDLSIANRLWRRTRPTLAYTARLIAEQQVDLVHLNDALPLAEAGVLAAWLRRRPSIVTVRSFAALDSFHRLLSRVPAAGVFTSAPLLREQREQGARFRRERIIFNAIDLSHYQNEPDRQGVRAEFGLAPEARIVCVVGRVMRRKGIDVFIRALAKVVRTFPDLHALIIGEEEITDVGLVRELQELADTLEVAAHVHFTGFRSDVPRLLMASDLLSFVPTLAEPFGRVVVEGMAAGLPVVGARSGAIPDIMVERETGLLVAPGDAQTQAQAIKALLADPARARQMGEAGKARAEALFSIENQVRQLVALYDEILAS